MVKLLVQETSAIQQQNTKWVWDGCVGGCVGGGEGEGRGVYCTHYFQSLRFFAIIAMQRFRRVISTHLK